MGKTNELAGTGVKKKGILCSRHILSALFWRQSVVQAFLTWKVGRSVLDFIFKLGVKARGSSLIFVIPDTDHAHATKKQKVQ